MNTNRIKQVLAEGKAVQCKTEDEARQLFEIAGWDVNAGAGMLYLYNTHGKDVFGATNDNFHINKWWCGFLRDYPDAIPFTALTRSRLAECLGVEDGQKFIFKNDVYSVECSGEKLRQWSSDGMNFWSEMEIAVLLDMIAHPEEITPCPRWSEAMIAAARVFEQAGFTEVTRHTRPRNYLILEVPDDNAMATSTNIDGGMFPEIHPGTAVKLEDIKNG